MLEQNECKQCLLSFDDIKNLIGYANICSSVHDHRLKFIFLKTKYWFWRI